MPTTTQPVQLHLRDGSPSQVGPWVGTGSDGPGHPASYSYAILIEPFGKVAARVGPGGVDTLLRHLRDRRGAVTSALQRGVKEVHQRLVVEHQRDPDPEAGGLGLACAALRGRELYLALAGPTAVWIIGPDGVEILRGARPGGPVSRRSLGFGQEPALRLYRRELDPAALVLLAFSSVHDGLAVAAVRDAATDGPAAVLAHVYRSMAPSLKNYAAVVLTPAERVLRSPHEPRSVHAAGRAKAARTTPAVDEAAVSPTAGSGLGVSPGELPAPMASAMSRTPPGPAISRPPEGLGLELRSPRRIPSRRIRGITVSPWAVLFLAIGFVMVILGLTLWYFQAEAATNREIRYAALQGEAASLYESALAAPSRDAMRQKLLQAREVADAAMALPRDVLDTSLIEAVRQRLTELDATGPLREPRVLVDLRVSAAGGSLLRDPVLLGSDLAVVDQGSGRLFRLPPGEPAWRPETPPAFASGRGAPPASLRRLVWMPAGGLWKRDALLAFDESRTLWEYRGGASATPAPTVAASPVPAATAPPGEGEWRRVPVRAATSWEGFEGAQGFNGNLYVLDPPSSQVWRYVPTDNGFDSERTGALTTGGDLREAVDFAVDGAMYVLLRSGKVLKFSGGRPDLFPMDGLDRRLSGPTALFTGPGVQHVYVADAGNQRVVAFDKAGVFRRQVLLPSSLPPVTDLLADETRGLLYLACGRELVVASFRYDHSASASAAPAN